jgi:hypothetical protein
MSGADIGTDAELKPGVSLEKTSHVPRSALASDEDMPTIAPIRSPAAIAWNITFTNFTKTPGATGL